MYASNYNEDGGVPDDGEDKPSLSKASSKKVVQEEFFDVTITRDVQGGTLGIAVDLWDGEVSARPAAFGSSCPRLHLRPDLYHLASPSH